MLRQPIKKRWQVLLGLTSILILISVYLWLSKVRHDDNPRDRSMPSITQLYEGIKELSTPNRRSGEIKLKEDLISTSKRLGYGLLVGMGGALLIGILMGCFKQIESFLIPALIIVSLIPATAALAIYFSAVGLGMKLYIAIVALGIGPCMAISISKAVDEIPEELLFKGYTLGASRFEMIYEIIFKLIFPKFIDQVKLNLPLAIVILIPAEMVCASDGIGLTIRMNFKAGKMDLVYPYLAILATFGFGTNCLLTMLQNFICPWYNKKKGDE